jgi:Xaa-Pro aminopeptidase
VKSTKEIDRLKKSTRIVEEVVDELRDSMKVGSLRMELAQQARRSMMTHGATGVDHLTMAFGPSNPEVMLDERLEAGQLVTIDLGAVYEGYVSDNRRLFNAGGPPSPDVEKLHDTLVRVVEDVGEALVPGAAFSDLYSRAVGLYEKVGLQPMFFHVGHSIGIQTEEAWISAESGFKVEENMVLNIELYAPDASGTMIGDEETFLVGKSGSEKITMLPSGIGLV